MCGRRLGKNFLTLVQRWSGAVTCRIKTFRSNAKIGFKVHPHMLRHAAGSNKGTDTRTLQAYLGHRSIQSTVRYTQLAPGRLKNLWR